MKFVDDFVDYCKDFTGCPEVFTRWSALYALSAAAGYNHVHRRGNWDVRPNLWILILGNSSSFKSSGLSSARKLLHEACPAVLASQEYSHEAFIEDVAQNPHRVFFYDEAESYWKMLAQKYNAPMRSAMMSLYNSVPLQRRIKGKDGHGETHTIEYSYICWSGASTPYQIATHLNGSTTDLLSGMLPRFIIVPYFGKETYIEDPPPDDKIKRHLLVERLQYLHNLPEREYKYTPAALEVKHQWLSKFSKRMETAEMLMSAFYKKMRDEHIHKLALLSAFERESPDMDVEDIENAIQFLWPVEREWGTLLERLTEREWDRDAMRVADFIKANRKVSRREILRGCRGIKAQKLSAILDGFVQDNQVRIDPKAGTADKPTTAVEWLDFSK